MSIGRSTGWVHFLGTDRELAGEHPRAARVLELRFFVGLSVEETARATGISTATVKRDWRLARAWVGKELRPR